MSARRVDLNLGDGHTLRWIEWNPDSKLNPQYADIAPLGPGEHHGAIVSESWAPLTTSPSLACDCGDHGFIRDGRWVRA